MTGEDFLQAPAGAEGLDLCVGETDAEVSGDLGKRHFIEMEQREDGALIGREMREKLRGLVVRGGRAFAGEGG